MAYFKHKSSFGPEFESNLEKLKELIDNIYSVKSQEIQNSNDKTIRLHSSTIDSASAFACIDSIVRDKITIGSTTLDYENKFSNMMSGYHVVSNNSGSSANLLAIATMVANGSLKRGDKVIVPALSWSTTIFPLAQYGLIPIFCDSNDVDYNLNCADLLKICELHSPKALMLIHTYGCPADMDEIMEIVSTFNLTLIEDTCESMGAKWRGREAGTFGLTSTFSSYFSHHICTLEGGLTCFRDKEDSIIAKSIRSHGWVRHYPKSDKIFEENTNIDPGFLFDHIGYNIRLSEPQASIGIQQLGLLESYINSRTSIATILSEYFSKHEQILSFIKPKKGATSSWFGFPIVLKEKLAGKRSSIREYFSNNGVETRPFLAGDFSVQPALKRFNYLKHNDNPVAKGIQNNGFALPCHQSLSQNDAHRMIDLFDNYLKEEL